MPSIKEEFLLIKFSRLIRDESQFPTTTVIIDQGIVDSIEDFALQQAMQHLITLDPELSGSLDPDNLPVNVTSTFST